MSTSGYEWINQWWYIRTIENYTVIQRSTLLTRTTGTDLRIIKLRERNQVKKEYILYDSVCTKFQAMQAIHHERKLMRGCLGLGAGHRGHRATLRVMAEFTLYCCHDVAGVHSRENLSSVYFKPVPFIVCQVRFNKAIF